MMLVIGNALSFTAAVFMAASSIVSNRSTIFILQFFECFILAVASFFFQSYAGITTLLLCAVRNLLTAKGLFTKKAMFVFVMLTAIFGVAANNMGIVGLLPVLATLQYTLCSYLLTGLLTTRISIFINTAVWVIYSFIIKDFSTGITDSIVLFVTAISIIKLILKNLQTE